MRGHSRVPTYTFTLEWVQEVPAHLAIVSRRARRVVHASHIIRGVLEEDSGRYRNIYETASDKSHMEAALKLLLLSR